MKHIKSLFVLTFLFILTGTFAQSSCHSYMPSKVGGKWEMTQYDAKEKKEGKMVYELLDKTTNGDKTTYKVKVIGYDKKDKETFTGNFEAICENGQYSIDADAFLASMLSTYKDMDVKITGTDLEIPKVGTAVGTELKEGVVTLDINVGVPMQIKVTTKDRKVVANESKTTDAGTYDCIQISQTTAITGMVNISSSSKEWYAEDIGLVRSENYDNKGNLTGYSVLTKVY